MLFHFVSRHLCFYLFSMQFVVDLPIVFLDDVEDSYLFICNVMRYKDIIFRSHALFVPEHYLPSVIIKIKVMQLQLIKRNRFKLHLFDFLY